MDGAREHKDGVVTPNPMTGAGLAGARASLLAGAVGPGAGDYGSSQTGGTVVDVSPDPSAPTSKPCKERIFGKLPSERAVRVGVLAFVLLQGALAAAFFATKENSGSNPAHWLAKELAARHAAMPVVLGSVGLAVACAAAAARNVWNFKRETKVIRNSRRTTPVSRKITTAVSSFCAYLWCMAWCKYPDQKLVTMSVLALASSAVGLMNIPSHGVMSGSATGSYFWDAVMGASLVAATLATLAAWAAARAVAPVASARAGAAAAHLTGSGHGSKGGGSGFTDGVLKVALSSPGPGAPSSAWRDKEQSPADGPSKTIGSTPLAGAHRDDSTGAEDPGLPGSVLGKPDQKAGVMPQMAHQTPGALRGASTMRPAGKRDGAAVAGGLGNRSGGARFGALAAAVIGGPAGGPG